jgi:hypothetical protein
MKGTCIQLLPCTYHIQEVGMWYSLLIPEQGGVFAITYVYFNTNKGTEIAVKTAA